MIYPLGFIHENLRNYNNIFDGPSSDFEIDGWQSASMLFQAEGLRPKCPTAFGARKKAGPRGPAVPKLLRRDQNYFLNRDQKLFLKR